MAFVGKAPDSYECVFVRSNDGPEIQKCSGTDRESCREDAIAACYERRHKLEGQFSMMSTTRYPTSRTPSAMVHEVDLGVSTPSAYYVTSDCGLEDDDEYEARRHMPRGANCNDFPACAYKNEVKREEAFFAAHQARKAQREAKSAAAPAPSSSGVSVTIPSTSVSIKSSSELAEGLYVMRPECVDSPDSGACADISTVCVERSGGRVVGRIARRSPVLVRNKVEEHLKVFEVDRSPIKGTLTLILPFENTSCKTAAYQPVSTTGQLSSDGRKLTLDYTNAQRDATTCKVVPSGPRQNAYYKASTGDGTCRSPVMMGPLPPVPMLPPLVGGGVN